MFFIFSPTLHLIARLPSARLRGVGSLRLAVLISRLSVAAFAAISAKVVAHNDEDDRLKPHHHLFISQRLEPSDQSCSI